MNGRRPTGAGAAGQLTGPNTVSSFRRPLGASLPDAERLVAFELRIRELTDAAEAIGEAIETIETGTAAEVHRAWGELRERWRVLEEAAHRPFRRPRP